MFKKTMPRCIKTMSVSYILIVLWLLLSNPKEPNCKKGCGPQKGYGEKKSEIQGDGQEMAVMVKILVMTIQVNLEPLVLVQNSPELLLLTFLPLTYHPLAATLDFTSFFPMVFLRAALFFTAWLFWIRYHFFLYLYTPKPAYDQLCSSFTCLFFAERRRHQDLNSFTVPGPVCAVPLLRLSNGTAQTGPGTANARNCRPQQREA